MGEKVSGTLLALARSELRYLLIVHLRLPWLPCDVYLKSDFVLLAYYLGNLLHG